MKQLFIFLAAFYVSSICGQTNKHIADVMASIKNLDCSQYRSIMDDKISVLGFNDSKIFIIGEGGKYYNAGMSTYFTEVPQVLKNNVGRNLDMIALEQAHVDLYHCDVKELELKKDLQEMLIKIEAYPSTKSDKSIGENISLYPNPTNGIVKLTGKVADITKIEILNASGSILKEATTDSSSIDLTSFGQGLYYVLITSNNNIQVRKVIVE